MIYFQITFKTEFVTSLARLVKERTAKDLKLHFDEMYVTNESRINEKRKGKAKKINQSIEKNL
jgi:hypothetical protein